MFQTMTLIITVESSDDWRCFDVAMLPCSRCKNAHPEANRNLRRNSRQRQEQASFAIVGPESKCRDNSAVLLQPVSPPFWLVCRGFGLASMTHAFGATDVSKEVSSLGQAAPSGAL